MAAITPLTRDGVLSRADWEASLDQLRASILLNGLDATVHPDWDPAERAALSRLPEEADPNVASIPGGALSAPWRADPGTEPPRQCARVPFVVPPHAKGTAQRPGREGHCEAPEALMIRTDAEYEQARAKLLEEKKRLSAHEAAMKDAGLDPAQLKRTMDPLRSFAMQLEEQVEAYDRMRRGRFEPIRNLAGLGQLLIAARIFARMSQRELAQRLGVHESQVSRDERNEYRTVTVDRANRILEAIGAVEFQSTLRPVAD